MTAGYTLRLGDFDMSPGASHSGVEVKVYGYRRGRPVPVTRVIDSLLQDGTLEQKVRDENRDQTILIGFDGPDSIALAAAEKALVLEANKGRNEIAWTPPDGLGATTVFDVLWSDLALSEEDDWDLDELRGIRVWELTLRCAPFGRSASETVVAALASGGTPTTVTIADGTSATGWASADGAITASSGQLLVPKASAPTSSRTDSFGNLRRTYAWRATRTLTATDFTATPYLTLQVDVETKATQSQIEVPSVYVDGIEVPLVAAVGLPPVDPSWNAAPLKCTYYVSDASATTVQVVGRTEVVNSTVGAVLLDNVTRSNVAPSLSTTGRESVRTVTVGGSARTQASIEVSHPTVALGRTIVYTGPSLGIVSPALGQWSLTAASATPDATTLSGLRYAANISGQVPTFQIPASQMPSGGYVLFLRAKAQSGTPTMTFTWTAETKIGTALLGQQSGSSAPTAMTTSYSLVPIGGMVLPPTEVADASVGLVKISIAGGAYDWDEALLFYMGDDAALTIVDAGSGTLALGSSHNSLWIEPPTLDHPAPRVMLGLNGVRETGFHAGEKAQAWGVHQFPPGEMLIFVATTLAANPEVPLRYFKRWPFHAAEDG